MFKKIVLKPIRFAIRLVIVCVAFVIALAIALVFGIIGRLLGLVTFVIVDNFNISYTRAKTNVLAIRWVKHKNNSN